MNEQDFITHKEAIMSLSDEQVLRPRMLVSKAIQLSENLAVWAKSDIEDLTNVGLDINLIESLPSRARALVYIQSKWVNEKDTTTIVSKKWKIESAKGYTLIALLKHNFKFAFRNNPDFKHLIKKIDRNKGHAGMIQALTTYSLLDEKGLLQLHSIGFDTALLTEASNLSKKLGKLLATYNSEKNQQKELRVMRDKAFLYLMIAVKEIRRVGQFVYYRNPERKKGYSIRLI